ncbi:pentatricopeptide repeat-containing protein At4g02750-like isoform X2 [Arachis ipaensis]|uniref:pentatricopeptide repeat-containing protein At4g02750-like isoform X2 n=1 Tax=Arachis ipaensis TaxID=130454 RepID=UPI000A2B926A|nr:pentatricopeptide repeat-containing protein At4g02750-like isoform X2 [Arachis ipaensis]XP_025639427.1 pentatricopeptide repeat-containing protein At4g02750 isoform X2 [Arachis hypogaea]
MLLAALHRSKLKRLLLPPLSTIQTSTLSFLSSPTTLKRRRHSLLPLANTFSTSHVYRDNLNIAALARAGNVHAARQLFDKMPARDSVTWNSMLTCYWQNGLLDHSRALFHAMPADIKTVVSWNTMIAGCVQNDMLDDAFRYFTEMPEKNAASYNAMISGFTRFGRMREAQTVFDEMPRRNVVSYTAMIDGYANMGGDGGIALAKELFEVMPQRNEVSWTVMISGLVENGLSEEAWELFQRMPERNVVATTAMITGFCKEGKVDNARALFEEIRCKDRVSWNIMVTDLSVSNALVTMYSKCGGIVDSMLAFGQISHPDVVSWNTIIAAFAQHGLYVKAQSYFDQMIMLGIQPDALTFLNLLAACCRAGRVDESVNLFHLMVHDYGIPPRSEHYTCLVDVMSRAGQLQRAYKMIQEMPVEADSSIWGAFLVACSVHSNVKLGELAASKILNLDPYNSGAYVMLSNIYAAAGMWKDVNRVRVLMKERGVKKQKAYSWMQIKNRIHCFVGGDPSHPNISDIHFALRMIALHMKVKGDTGDNFF